MAGVWAALEDEVGMADSGGLKYEPALPTHSLFHLQVFTECLSGSGDCHRSWRENTDQRKHKSSAVECAWADRQQEAF